jgi:threonine aldolase
VVSWVLKALSTVNEGHVVGYGDDPYTDSAVREFKRQFGDDIEVFFVFNGTAANCLSLKALTNSYDAVICAEGAHINVDECGAPEKFTGCKLIPIPAKEGKLTVEAVTGVHGIGDQHHVQPRVISITQATEVGTVYKPDEIRRLATSPINTKCFYMLTGRGSLTQRRPGSGIAEVHPRPRHGRAFIWRDQERRHGSRSRGLL